MEENFNNSFNEDKKLIELNNKFEKLIREKLLDTEEFHNFLNELIDNNYTPVSGAISLVLNHYKESGFVIFPFYIEEKGTKKDLEYKETDEMKNYFKNFGIIF